MTSSLLLLLITSFLVPNWPKSLWITVLLLLPSQYLRAPLVTPHSPWGLEELLASQCFLLVSFAHLLSIWIRSLTFIPKVIITFDPIIYSYHCYLFFSVIFHCQLNSGPVLSCWKSPESFLFSAFCQCLHDFCAGLWNFISLIKVESSLLCYFRN